MLQKWALHEVRDWNLPAPVHGTQIIGVSRFLR